jgi:hypothetical protein
MPAKGKATAKYNMKMKSYGQGKSPLKGLLGKILNPAQMIPGKIGKFMGKLPGSNL